MIKFPDFCSIYTAEAHVVYHALETIQQLKIDKALILSDSLSTMNSVRNINQLNAISRMIQNQISLLNHNNQNVTLLWIPSHAGIPGNKTADTYDKIAITSTEASLVQICSLGDITVATSLDSITYKIKRNQTFYQPLANTHYQETS
ncbi:unnamed protein product [Macrosiphum euphorbiae]|uniref:RNase H type-1 domain-containing protein n=1 Tax=Macrosiphum euphorbiae TaxID=13131 RepID=A0AAV0W9N9_9HEMI|nr:unnamed protein product [Macrosiphum euphorbiae]